jgi:hypothetical protein
MLSRFNSVSKAAHFKQLGLRRFAYGVWRMFPRPFVRTLNIGQILMSGAQCTGYTYSRLTGDLVTPSTPIADSPHVQFLRKYREIGDSIFQPDQFAATPYCKYALKCIEIYGRYFCHTDAEGMLERARSFARMCDGIHSTIDDPHQTRAGAPVVVRRIRFSDCYELLDGHHRLAVAVVNGLDTHLCSIMPTEGAVTPMQLMVMDSVWFYGKRELCQPLPFPELQGWPVSRQCTDRLDLMVAWLKRNGIASGTFLDVGSSYGWFVSEMSKRGFRSSGVEQNGALAALGAPAYGLEQSSITVKNLAHFLKSAKEKYDVVCCLSILQAYLLKSENTSPVEFIQLLDRITGSVLFFETGESHESRLKHTLSGWDAHYIRNWLHEHTSFSRIEILGTDNDREGLIRTRYGRHLFACYREK